jgi:hypothetical protein
MTLEKLKELFYYKDGNLVWNVDRSDKVKKGKIAGCLRKDGYISIVHNGKTYQAHRLIFFYHNSYLPKFIDHKNNNRSDNKIENLRECTIQQNMQNRVKYGNHKYKGVYKSNKKFKVQIMDNSKLIYLGSYKTEEEAAIVYNNIAKDLYGEFAYINKV